MVRGVGATSMGSTGVDIRPHGRKAKRLDTPRRAEGVIDTTTGSPHREPVCGRNITRVSKEYTWSRGERGRRLRTCKSSEAAEVPLVGWVVELRKGV